MRCCCSCSNRYNGDREAEDRTSGKPEVPSMAGSTEGTRENNQSHRSHKRLCVGNRFPLARPIRYFSQHLFWGGYPFEGIRTEHHILGHELYLATTASPRPLRVCLVRLVCLIKGSVWSIWSVLSVWLEEPDNQRHQRDRTNPLIPLRYPKVMISSKERA